MGKAKKLGVRRFYNKGYKLDSPNINKSLSLSNSIFMHCLYYTIHNDNSKQDVKNTSAKMELTSCGGPGKKIKSYKIDETRIRDRYSILVHNNLNNEDVDANNNTIKINKGQIINLLGSFLSL